MNKESIKNRRLVAGLIVVALLVLSIGSDMLNMKVASLETEQSFLMDRFSQKLKSDVRTEEILAGSDSANRIIQVNILGVIAGSDSYMYGGYDHSRAMESIDLAIEDPSIKAVLLNVDSPGGTVYHSAQLWNKLMELKEKKKDIKIYTSMGTVAASGGYYVAAPSDKIFAAQETVTGSIGVIADYINYSGLEEKVGIKHNVIKSAEFKDIGSPNRPMTEKEREILSETVMESYEKFLDVVAQGRKIPKDQLRTIADGRTYSGTQAKKNHLIDEIGYYDDALEALRLDLKLEDPEIIELSSGRLDMFSSIFGMELSSLLAGETNQIQLLKQLKNTYGPSNTPSILYLLGGY